MTGERTPQIDEDHMDIPELRAAMEEDGAAWSALLAENPSLGPRRRHALGAHERDILLDQRSFRLS